MARTGLSSPPSVPRFRPVANAEWGRNPTDRFVLANLETEGLTPAPEADRATLLRLVTLDLPGSHRDRMKSPPSSTTTRQTPTRTRW